MYAAVGIRYMTALMMISIGPLTSLELCFGYRVWTDDLERIGPHN